MAPRTFSNEEFAGSHVRFPLGFADRLLDVARADLAGQLRYIDDNEEPGRVLELWLAGKQTVPMPSPRAEAGDLLIKVGRAEYWALTLEGWRELAPIELQAEILDPAAWAAAVRDLDEPGGVKARAGYSNPIYEAGPLTGPPSRFFGRSVVEDELDRARAQREPFPAGVQATLDELLHHHNVLEDIAAALEQGEDGGNNHPFFESAATARVFARALDYARRRLLVHATDAKTAAR